MTHQSDLIATDIEAYLAEHERKELLRFITCGSVDDGKSTLIGRLFYDSKLIYEDTLAALHRDSATHGTTGGGFDPALFTDGLKAEREQGITIDVAYRYFSTSKRKFIIADTPGHAQYTRNMATGASTADLAIILVDARHGVLEQTRRHTFIVTLLGIKHVLVAVNKMDLVDFRQDVFEKIQSDYRDFIARLDLPDLHFIPISALRGDNVVDRSSAMPWYGGPTMLSFLDNVYIGSDRNLEDFRFPVQYVNRPHLDFRGFCGTIASGIIRRGETIMALPSRKTTRIKEIVTLDGNLEEAFAPQSVTLTLADEIDVSRSEMIVRPGNIPTVDHRFEAVVVWMNDAPLVPGKQYLFKHTTRTTPGSISTLRYRIDVNTLHRQDAPTLGLNDIGRCAITLNQPLMFDAFKRNRATGSFIVIDRLSNLTVGAGMILDRHTSSDRPDKWDYDPTSQTLAQEFSQVSAGERAARFGQQAVTVLLSGVPGAGKSTTAYALERYLFDQGRGAAVLDGQNLRLGLSRDLGFSADDRSENVRRTAEVAKVLNAAGLIAIVSLVAPEEAVRQRAADVIGRERFVLVHLAPPASVLAQRQAESSPTNDQVHYEPPQAPDLVLDTSKLSTPECVRQIVEVLVARGALMAH